MLIFFLSCNQSKKITIIGDIKNVDYTKVYFSSAYDWGNFLDSADVINGKFIFKIPVKNLNQTIYSIAFLKKEKIKTFEFLNHIRSNQAGKFVINSFIISQCKLPLKFEPVKSIKLV